MCTNMLVQKTQNVCLGAKASFLLCPLTYVPSFRNITYVNSLMMRVAKTLPRKAQQIVGCVTTYDLHVYTGLLFYEQTLRCMQTMNMLSPNLGDLLTSLEQVLPPPPPPPTTSVVPGPLVNLMTALSTVPRNYRSPYTLDLEKN